jgi:hypothetical protein
MLIDKPNCSQVSGLAELAWFEAPNPSGNEVSTTVGTWTKGKEAEEPKASRDSATTCKVMWILHRKTN